MLWKNYIYYHVYMRKEKGQCMCTPTLLEKERIVSYQDGDIKAWCDIQVASGHIDSFQEAKTYFEKTFLSNPQTLPRRMFFLVNENNEYVGTITLWKDVIKEADMPRLHWLAVKDNQSGKGYAKALISYLLAQCEETIFLSTQSWSLPAIHLYLQAGFQPWNPCDDTDYTHAWEYIIKELKHSKCNSHKKSEKIDNKKRFG